MSDRVNKFCTSLQGKLNDLEDRLKSLKTSLQSAPKQAEDALHKQLDKAAAKGRVAEQAAAKARTSVQNWIDQKKAEAKATIDHWKTEHEAKKLEHRRRPGRRVRRRGGPSCRGEHRRGRTGHSRSGCRAIGRRRRAGWLSELTVRSFWVGRRAQTARRPTPYRGHDRARLFPSPNVGEGSSAMFQSILVPLDSSQFAEQALPLALNIAIGPAPPGNRDGPRALCVQDPPSAGCPSIRRRTYASRDTSGHIWTPLCAAAEDGSKCRLRRLLRPARPWTAFWSASEATRRSDRDDHPRAGPRESLLAGQCCR